ncbi:probable protein S-acyltransferase 22, partial [Phalaenopsis equestris]|uniref:probable protein S-acyltransferase 22 n=1 Tax=Phalaenopsis equestris TaxID=78828 RepID=UPI0009E3AC79
SKILQPIVKHIPPVPNPDNRKRSSNREIILPTEFPIESSAKLSTGVTHINTDELASGLAPLQFEARSAFRSIRAVSSAVPTSSPDSSLDSPEPNPFRISSSGVEDSEGPISLPSASAGAEIHRSAEFSRSTSDGYEASGGEDSDIIPSRIVHRSLNWSNVIFNSDRGERIASRRIG